MPTVLSPAAARPRTSPARGASRKAGALALGLALLAALLLAGCFPDWVVLEDRDGVRVTLRDDPQGMRPPPGPDFTELHDYDVERSLRRLVVRVAKVTVFYKSDPVPLFSDEQLAVVKGVLLRELPKLPRDKRIGVTFEDIYRQGITEIEIYPEGNFLVYEFLKLVQRQERRLRDNPVNLAVIFPQRDQEYVDDPRHPVVKDPIASAAKPDFRMLDEKQQKLEEESPL